MAWTWQQLDEELIRRDQLDANALQKKITTTQIEFRQLTESLIDTKAWGKQLERLQQDNSMRQALVGWLDTMKHWQVDYYRIDMVVEGNW